MAKETVKRVDKAFPDEGNANWPSWQKGIVTALLMFHGVAILAGALAAAPASLLEQSFASGFSFYHQLIDQGYSYRYYAPEPGPTAIVTATIVYADGRPEEIVRLPMRGVLPRLRYQRQLALANHLATDYEEARRETGDGANSVWAKSYARHLAKTRPGSTKVILHTLSHLIPDPARVADSRNLATPIDIDDEEFYTTPERIGEFACNAL